MSRTPPARTAVDWAAVVDADRARAYWWRQVQGHWLAHQASARAHDGMMFANGRCRLCYRSWAALVLNDGIVRDLVGGAA